LPVRCTAPPCSVRRRPLRPAILWNDGRSFAECAALEADEPRTRAITGNIAMPGFTAPKLAWVRKHEPDVFAATRTVLLPKDYVRLALTGEKASDMSDSAGTLWLDVAGRAWSGEMLAATGLDERHMPRLHEGPDVTGVLREDVARDWGMGRVPVVAGAGDNAAGALGVGVLDDGQGMLSLGTSGVIFVANAAFRPNPAQAVHAFCHALPGVWHQMSVHLSAASCIDWAARACNVPGPAEFFALAEQAGAASGGELFLPYLSGERTPHNDPHIRAAFSALATRHTAPGRRRARRRGLRPCRRDRRAARSRHADRGTVRDRRRLALGALGPHPLQRARRPPGLSARRRSRPRAGRRAWRRWPPPAPAPPKSVPVPPFAR
jgi:xylulokinase